MHYAFIRKVGCVHWFVRTFIRQIRKRVFRCGCLINLPTGIAFPIPISSYSGSEVFVTNADVDWGVEALLARLVTTDTVFLDIGANIGYYSAYLYPLVHFCHAFEPDRRALPHLESLATLYPRIRVYNAGVSDRCGTSALLPGMSSETTALSDSSWGQGTNAINAIDAIDVCRICSIDSKAGDFSRPVGAIKIDTEGHEKQVLNGADLVIRRDRPIIALESNVALWLVQWADRMGYSMGSPVEDEFHNPIFLWFQGPSECRTKMIVLVPTERYKETAAAAAELYDPLVPYHRSLRRFQLATQRRALQQR